MNKFDKVYNKIISEMSLPKKNRDTSPKYFVADSDTIDLWRIEFDHGFDTFEEALNAKIEQLEEDRDFLFLIGYNVNYLDEDIYNGYDGKFDPSDEACNDEFLKAVKPAGDNLESDQALRVDYSFSRHGVSQNFLIVKKPANILNHGYFFGTGKRVD